MLSQDADKFGVPPTFPAAVGQLPAWRNDPPGLQDVRSGHVPFYHARDDHGGVVGRGSLSGAVYSQRTPAHMPMHEGSTTGAGSFTAALCGEYKEPFSDGLPRRIQPARGGRGRGGCTPPPPACPAEASGSGKDVGGQETNNNPTPVNEGVRKGQTPAKKIVPWTLEECLALAKWQREDDAMMADASVRHKCMKKGERQEWVSERMKEEGMMRSAEDCRKKRFNLGQKLKLLVDKVGRSDHQSYWDMTEEEREAEGLYATFDQRLWQAMKWVLQRPSGTCDEAMNSDTMGGVEAEGTGGGSGEQAGSDRGGSDTPGSRSKFRRTSDSRVHVGDDPSSVSFVGVAMAESTRVYVDGLDRVATTIAQVSKEGATIIAGSIGEMATQIGAVASAMGEGNAVLQLLETKVDQCCHPRGRMDFSPDTADLHSRVYYVLVEGTLAMKIDGCFGYDKEDNLVDVILNVKKLSEVVPDEWRLPECDVVSDIVRYLVSTIADEHMVALHGNAFYVAHMQPPLRGRQYLHGAVQSWCPKDDMKVARRRW
ncbi:hypothetical protein CBR_g10926 [Chara braunii]|uniref:Myb-like domain-containing protein n=1 Tax=Chara braunii TaxID=69332 RepID=A0A388KPM9_CHABU|nr:hypothetical protein CBR_g10926 [Chara braunii]|eukprot:GBG71987.1 hypothetical protein CBR_g10926 [Chara braunii]